MDGLTITPQFVGACFAVAAVAVAVTIWIVSNYQTKADAKEERERKEAELKDLRIEMDRDVQDLRHSITQVWKKMNEVQDNMTRVAVDVAYIRGRVEPKT